MKFAEPRLFALGLSLLAVAAASLLEGVLGLDISETAVFVAALAAFLGVCVLARILDRLAGRKVGTDV
ncbi:hypothetical protein Q8W71_15990 [Methylobacterium sp. NEAU 140]|uniref:hypothetical protein n=1 Tax=Methylobacterium sp. NEAU 140 TaxID=3064945 RepID=UPI002734FBFC|nr:hypothetical protein [Methylobacterium sp. NEAU 140]MDP4024131.1 hypothetical protein [Methylobacterium sp. NEAU 140]